MSDPVTLNYGGKKLTLEKSDTLVAVKARPGMEPSLQRTLSKLSTIAPGSATEKLGGFQIVAVDSSAQPANDQLDALRSDPSVSAASHVFHTSEDNVPFVPTGAIYIEFKTDQSNAERQELLNQLKLQITEVRDQGNTVIVRTTAASPNPVKAAAAIQASGKVDIAEPDLATPSQVKAFAFPTDSLLAEQWHLRNSGQRGGATLGFKANADANVIAAWERLGNLGSSDIVVAIIDDGFDLRHPDLAAENKIVAAWDFSRNGHDPSPNPATDDWHGTACAGVSIGIAGGGNIVGAAPKARFMPVRWGPNLSGEQIEAWFNYVREQGAWVVSCSWGAQADYFLVPTRAQRAIARCAREGRGGKGTVIVFAAGNANRDVNDPTGRTLDGFAVLPEVIAVAASTSMDERSHYSNYGKEIAICAPSSGAGGWGILTADVTGSATVNGVTVPLGYSPTDYTYDFGGTSSACPLVAGICALVLSANRDLTAQAVGEILKTTARRIGGDNDYDESGHSVHFGYGCVDAAAAVVAALAQVLAS